MLGTGGKGLVDRVQRLTKALQRLQKAGRIMRVMRGFHVIVPAEYQVNGIVPPDWFIDDLMRFAGCRYYVGVLSAASMHGAAHQQPQEYHVVVSRSLRPIRTRTLHMRFFWKQRTIDTPTVMVKGDTGSFPVSSPAATAMDCERYAHAIGGLDAVMTVPDELVQDMNSEDLMQAAVQEQDLSIVQRTGWLLEHLSRPEIVQDLRVWMNRRRPSKTRLDVRAPAVGCKKDPVWNVIVNSHPASDL